MMGAWGAGALGGSKGGEHGEIILGFVTWTGRSRIEGSSKMCWSRDGDFEGFGAEFQNLRAEQWD